MGGKTKGTIMRKTVFLLIGIIGFVVLASFVQRNTRYYSVRDIGVKEGAWYDVRMYGAIAGDLISDVSAGQEAADSIKADGGGTLFFPPGQYEFYGDSIRIYSNTTVSAYGAVFNDTTGGDQFFIIDGDSDIVFMGGEWNGNADVDGGYTENDMGITIRDAFRVWIQDVFMHDLAGDGVYIADADDITITNSTIHSTHLQDSPFIGRNGIAVVEGSRIILSNNQLSGGDPADVDIEPNPGLIASFININGNTSNGAEIGISINAASEGSSATDINIINNIVTGTVEEGIRSDLAARVNISGNNVSSSTAAGIDITAGNIDVLIMGNTIYGGAGNGIETHSTSHSIHIMGNKIHFNDLSGILIGGTSGNENKDVAIVGNYILNNSQGTDNTSDGILINFTDRLLVANNYVATLSSVAKHHRNGIRVANCDSVSYTGNLSFDAATADHSTASTTFREYSHNASGSEVTQNNSHSDFRAPAGADLQIRLNTSQSFMIDNASGNAQFTVSATGELTLSTNTKGTGTFTTTAETDTVTITGAAATDEYFLSPKGTADAESDDVLYWEARSGELVVHRPAGGTSNLVYSWLRIN